MAVFLSKLKLLHAIRENSTVTGRNFWQKKHIILKIGRNIVIILWLIKAKPELLATFAHSTALFIND